MQRASIADTRGRDRVKREVYRYPIWLRGPLYGFGLIVGLLAVWNFFRHAVLYLRVSKPLNLDLNPARTWMPQPISEFFAGFLNSFASENPTQGLLWPFLQSIFLLMAALLLSRFLNSLLPDLHVGREGLVLITMNGETTMPWGELMRLHSTELGRGQYFIVLVEGSDDSLQLIHRVYAWLFGPVAGPGFLIISSIKNFDALVQEIIQYRMSTYHAPRSTRGQAGPTSVSQLINEDNLMPATSVPLEPQRSLARLTGLNPGGKGVVVEEGGTPLEDVEPKEEDAPPPPRIFYSRGRIIQAAMTLAALPAVIFLLDMLLFGLPNNRSLTGLDFGDYLNIFVVRPLLLFLLALAEIPVAAGVIYAIGEIFTGESGVSNFRLAAAVYPLTQMFRAVLLTVGAVLVIANLGFFVILLWLGGAVAGAYIAGLLTSRLYPIDQRIALVSGAGTLVYQLILLGIFGSFHL